MRIRHSLLLVSVCVFLSAFPYRAFTQIEERATPLVVAPIDDAQLTALRGTVHPLAQARYDQGAVNASTPAERLLLLLNRPPDREAAFQQYLKDVQTPGSGIYHQWLKPAEIGARFGVADADVEAVSGWLSGAGFRVSRISAAKRFVEFSGTVGQVNSAFHTQVHAYAVNGVVHHANATEIRIPQALAAVVAGLSPVNDFRATLQMEAAGQATWNAAGRRMTPNFTGGASWSPLMYAVAPADFATQYDLGPLYSAGTTGTGETIGIIDESNIDLSEVAAYRSVFGLAANPVQVVLDGGDPGWNDSQGEAYLDVELAGAVAPAATVNLYLSAGSAYQDPLVLAAERAVDDDQADVLSISFGEGEYALETSGNQFWNALWEQAAAQGQTVLVAAGDYGQAPDILNLEFGGYDVNPGVSGIASTPWNVAVGGTDFYYSDYATGAASAANDWNATNNPTTKGSLIASLPEQVWNDAFGLDAISDGLARNEIYAGGGGASSCITGLNASGSCTQGYAKPGWQSGPGVPADQVRDLPDVALYASNGANYSAYAICDYEGACVPDASGNFGVDLVGGTSASAPAMAGIMALVDQKYGRQGQADFTLYPLAQQKPASFHDITMGGNWDLCVAGDADCTLGLENIPGLGESTVYAATAGYDQASGLGSVDAAALVNNWSAISFKATTTTLGISPTTVVHGHGVTVDATVAATGGSGTPTGAVAVLTNSTLPGSRSEAVIPLAGGSGVASLSDLPGGTYEVTAQYGGDGVYAGSTSAAQTLTVSAEKSTLNLTVVPPSGTPLSGLTYGIPVTLNAQPVGAAGQADGSATGSVAFGIDGALTPVPLNVGGIASFTAPALAVGSHMATAVYNGDGSFEESAATPVTFSVGKGLPYINMNQSFAYSYTGAINAGSSITASIQVGTYYGAMFSNTQFAPVGTLAPTGTVTGKLVLGNSDPLGIGCAADPTGLAESATLESTSGIYGQYSTAEVVFPNVPAGFYMLCASYGGDANWAAEDLIIVNYITVAAPATPPAASTTTVSVTPSSISGGQTATLTATVTGSSVAPTGYISFFDNGSSFGSLWLWQLTPAATGASASFTLTTSSAAFWSTGVNQITAVYSGDGNYLPSTSSAVDLTVGAQSGADFTMTPELPQINVASGATVSTSLNLASLDNFNGSVALSCATSASNFSCSISPASVNLNGTATASVGITAVNPVVPVAAVARLGGSGGGRGGAVGTRVGAGGAALALALAIFVPWRRRNWRVLAGLMLVAVALVTCGCGGNGKTSTGPPPNPNGTPAGSYSILITGTSGGIVHNVKLAVIVTAQ